MAFVGAFLGGSPKAMIPAGKSLLTLQWQAEVPTDTPGASFTVTGPGVNQTVTAGADGRATLTVDAGKTYTVAVTHAGEYNGDQPQTVIAESQKAYLVAFLGTQNIEVVEAWE